MPFFGPLRLNQTQALVVQEAIVFGDEDAAPQKARCLLGHCHEQIAFIQNEAVRYLANVVFLLASSVTESSTFKEIAWR